MFNLLTSPKGNLPAKTDGQTEEGQNVVPTDDTAVIRAGLLVIAIAFGGLLIWSVFAPIAKGVVAPGSVVVDTNRKTIQHLEGGIVAEILVRDGDQVKAGQVLMRLDEVTPQAQRDVLYGQYLTARAQEARFIAEREGAKAVTFPEELTGEGVHGRNAAIRATEEEVFRSRREAMNGQLSIYEQRIRQLQEQMKGMEAQVEANTQQITLIDGELEGLQQLFEKGYASKTRLLQLQRERAELDGNRGNYVAEIARSRVAMGEAQLQILQIRRAFEEDVAKGMQDARSRIYDLQDRLTSANDVLSRREVRAPGDGIIVNSRVHTVGGVVRAGDPLMELVPMEDELIIEAHVSPIDIDVVSVGMMSEVRFSALAQRNMPTLMGTVMTVAADVTTDQNGARYYVTRVRVDEDEMVKLGDQKLVPGMPADVLVKAGEHSVVAYLLMPIADGVFRAFKEM
ncbi:HlyD family type I secretion periplasmic adaptor subunit [Niveispirillum fermenti]|uniref:HlyD family type I secretion periplasmic adaptor subunit n=1 Tax=Niveispirillum fermenti TaxID=1233113 RepID=UPI003A8A32C0